ncbi:MAG TPA: cobalamin-binding protein [Candidatus Rifleibacterium sp.]|nr:cobalamin-binding protein [Candidatus Rifleibacterium sp.]HPW57897.1 cobalamin-binding protein [Candidatus Rifleibacterium sp.]
MTQRATAVLLLFLSVFLLSAVNASETRVISLVPSQTEMIYALGLENCMVGRSDYCNFPPEAQQKPSIGNMELNIEKIVSLRPTLLLDTNGMHQRYAPLFQQLGLRYVNMPTTSLQQVKEAAAKVAELLGNPKAGERFSEDWDARLRRIAPDQSEKPVSVYFEIWDTPTQAAGDSSFIGEIIRQAGGRNIYASQGDYPVVNPETLLKEDPEVILLSYPVTSLENIKKRPGWSTLRAIKGNHLYALDQDLFVRPGPRNLNAVDRLHEIFKKVRSNE